MTRSEFEEVVKKTVKLTASQYTGFAKASTPHGAIHFVGTFTVKKDHYNFKFENDKSDKGGIKHRMQYDFNTDAPDIGANEVMSEENIKGYQECIMSAFQYIESVYFAYDMRRKYASMERDVFDDYWFTLQRCLHFALPCIADAAVMYKEEDCN